MLKTAPNFVLGHAVASRYLHGTSRLPHSLGPCWLTVLSILSAVSRSV